MGIRTGTDYVRFYLNLEMKDVSLISFVNNEKMVLKSKMENKNLNKSRLQEGIAILEQLSQEISQIGEKGVLERYGA
ncbi:MAG: hypothetical protein K5785_03320 [Nitrosarchaeum sp.]|nr:hypothetical protein [Nitrosarchaeum sp.]